MITPLFMHHALRSSLALVAFGAIASLTVLTGLTGCRTHDRRIYSTHPDKNLHTPSPWAPSTTKAADEATSPLGVPSQPAAASEPIVPGAPPVPANQ